jgi:hypothetical protein
MSSGESRVQVVGAHLVAPAIIAIRVMCGGDSAKSIAAVVLHKFLGLQNNEDLKELKYMLHTTR